MRELNYFVSEKIKSLLLKLAVVVGKLIPQPPPLFLKKYIYQ